MRYPVAPAGGWPKAWGFIFVPFGKVIKSFYPFYLFLGFQKWRKNSVLQT